MQQGIVTTKSDIYAAGVILFEMWWSVRSYPLRPLSQPLARYVRIRCNAASCADVYGFRASTCSQQHRARTLQAMTRCRWCLLLVPSDPMRREVAARHLSGRFPGVVSSAAWARLADDQPEPVVSPLRGISIEFLGHGCAGLRAYIAQVYPRVRIGSAASLANTDRERDCIADPPVRCSCTCVVECPVVAASSR